MTIVEIRNSPCFSLFSYGNGWAYELKANVPPYNGIWLQDDDATEFMDELEAYENSHPDESTEKTLREFVARYRS